LSAARRLVVVAALVVHAACAGPDASVRAACRSDAERAVADRLMRRDRCAPSPMSASDDDASKAVHDRDGGEPDPVCRQGRADFMADNEARLALCEREARSPFRWTTADQAAADRGPSTAPPRPR
jgi:hypothetical protein